MKLDAGLNKYADEEWVYELEIKNINATDNPPRLTLDGVLKTRSIFNFLTSEVSFPLAYPASTIELRKEVSNKMQIHLCHYPHACMLPALIR